jgi:probable HAF family extracellular repeat protein
MRRWMLVILGCAAGCGQYVAKATVTIAVTGPGAVRGSGLAGDCRATCWFSVPRETPVHLEAVTDGQTEFAGWSGACNGAGACDLTPGSDVSVAATFMPAPPPQQRRLQVSLNGAGAVHSDPAGIDCPQNCAAEFPEGTAVYLQASASSGWDFQGFGGACSGPACTITLSNDASAWANFLQRPVRLSVTLAGTGSVVSSPAGIDCPRVCSAIFTADADVALAATPGAGFSFSGFSGGCTGGSCSMRLAADAEVAAAFAVVPMFKVVVLAGGTGRGRVTSNPAGIDCPGKCSATLPDGTALVLSAAPDVLSKFGRYDGSCTGARCALTIRADAAIGVEFDQRRYVAIDLGTLPGGWWSSAAAISPRNTLVAGTSGGNSQLFFWDGSMHDTGISQGIAAAVNDDGIIAGSFGVGYEWHAVRWQARNSTDLGTLGGTWSYAYALNGDGIIAGVASRADNQMRAVYWNSKGIVDLGSLGAAWNACSAAYGINSEGIIVGETCTVSAGTRAARFRAPGVIDELGSLGGYSQARAINDAGVIVGYSYLPGGYFHGFVHADGKMTDAGSVSGMSYSQLMAVNGAGLAVGTAFDGGGLQRGVAYGGGRMVDLNAVTDGTAYTITSATGIDEAGNIAAQGLYSGYSRALLLRPW